MPDDFLASIFAKKNLGQINEKEMFSIGKFCSIFPTLPT